MWSYISGSAGTLTSADAAAAAAAASRDRQVPVAKPITSLDSFCRETRTTAVHLLVCGSARLLEDSPLSVILVTHIGGSRRGPCPHPQTHDLPNFQRKSVRVAVVVTQSFDDGND